MLKRRQIPLYLPYVMMAPPLFPTCIFTSIQPRVSHISHRQLTFSSVASWVSQHKAVATHNWLLFGVGRLKQWCKALLCYPGDRRASWPNPLSLNPLCLSWVFCTLSLKAKPRYMVSLVVTQRLLSCAHISAMENKDQELPLLGLWTMGDLWMGFREIPNLLS